MLYLGKGPAAHDPFKRTLHAENYLVEEGLPIIPDIIDWASAVKEWEMFGNDTMGCCTVASGGHLIEAWTAYSREEVNLTDTDILAAYKAVSGYDGTEATDNGAVMLDVLKHWRTVGIGGRKIGAFMRVNHKDMKEIMTSLYLFGGLYIGVGLPKSAESQFADGKPWEVVPWWKSGRKFNSWGGHCISLHKGWVKDGRVWAATWARLQEIAEGFFLRYTDEAFAIVSPDWIRDTGLAPSGLNMEQLITDLNRVTK